MDEDDTASCKTAVFRELRSQFQVHDIYMDAMNATASATPISLSQEWYPWGPTYPPTNPPRSKLLAIRDVDEAVRKIMAASMRYECKCAARLDCLDKQQANLQELLSLRRQLVICVDSLDPMDFKNKNKKNAMRDQLKLHVNNQFAKSDVYLGIDGP